MICPLAYRQRGGAFLSSDILQNYFEKMLHGIAYCRVLYEDNNPHDFVILYTNPAFRTLTGLGAVRGQYASIIVPGIRESNAELFKICGAVAAGGAAEKFEIFIDGLQLWVSAQVFSSAPEHFIAIFDGINQRKAIEQTLFINEKFYKGLLEDQTEIICRFKADGTTIFVNEAYCRLFGKSRESLVGQKWQSLAWEEDVPLIHEKLKSLSPRNPVVTIENRIVTAGGILRWGQFVNRAFFDDDGVIQEMQMVGRDITDLKQIELNLQTSESRFRAFMDNGSFISWMKDEGGHHVYLSKRYEERFGVILQDWFGKTDFDLFPRHIAEIFRQNDVEVLHSSQPIVVEECTTDPDGRKVYWLSTKFPYVDSVGNRFVGGIGVDITDRKQAENSLRISAIAFETQEGVVITDANGLFLRVNNAFTKITGYTQEEIIGKNPRILQSGHQNAEFYAEMWADIKKNGSWSGEIWNRRKNGESYPEHLTITAVVDKNDIVTNYVGTFTDITMSQAAAEEIKYLAFYDPLTDLPNRRLLRDRLKPALASSLRSGRKGALLFIDMDNFKTLNDSLGHDMGDLLLQQIAQRIVPCVREGDTVARLGGDEFVVMLEDLSEQILEAAAQTETIGNKILSILNQPYQIDTHYYHCTSSIGAILFDEHEQTVDELLKQADIAMYQAKAAGRNALRFFDPQMQVKIDTRVALETNLHLALTENQFELFYQPQVNHKHQIIGAEVLIRWNHPQNGYISPADFIPLAEGTGLILPIGQWVLETACAQLKIWAGSEHTQHLQLAVNVSARQFYQPDFVKQVSQNISLSAINPARLKLELTESLVLDDIEETIYKMNVLREIGVRFSMDDFGTGYSSLSSLKKLPLSQLKIDQSFVRDLSVDPDDAVIVQTIIAMAKSLGMGVIAEGVETEAQRSFLEQHDCPLYQGYLFSKPVPIEKFELLLKKNLL